MIDPPDQPGSFRDRDEVVGGDNPILVVAQPRHRLVEAHLALRQRHHRLQENIDAVFLQRVSHGGEDLRLAAGWRGFICNSSRRRRGGLDRTPGIFGGKRLPLRFMIRFARRRRRGGQRARGQHVVMIGDRHRELLDQHTEFVDLAGHGLDAVGAGRICRGYPALDGGEAAAEFGDLAGEIGGAARQIRDLAADIGAVAQPHRYRVVEDQEGQRC